jgi:hypothetical protein
VGAGEVGEELRGVGFVDRVPEAQSTRANSLRDIERSERAESAAGWSGNKNSERA